MTHKPPRSMSIGSKSKTSSRVTTISFHICLQGLRKVWREIVLVHVSRTSNGEMVCKGFTCQVWRQVYASSLINVQLGEYMDHRRQGSNTCKRGYIPLHLRYLAAGLFYSTRSNQSRVVLLIPSSTIGRFKEPC